MHVKLGPISLTFATDVKREEFDAATRRARLTARGREVRGRGGGQATRSPSTGAGSRKTSPPSSSAGSPRAGSGR